MHSYLSNKNQPYITADYSIFVAEVASTLNENLLLHHMLKITQDDATRLYLLGSALDNMRQTLFRQTLFAEFEKTIHDMAERGETLSGDNLSALYLKLLREYYGHDQGICVVDDLYGVEWAYIPHFYYNFYVYQYATSLTASSYIADAIRQEAGGKKPSTRARDAYLKMLSSGSSKYPIDLLRDAGVDMTTSAPFDAAMREMNRIMDEMEAILARQKK
jgi:oligoendopeptidase F